MTSGCGAAVCAASVADENIRPNAAMDIHSGNLEMLCLIMPAMLAGTVSRCKWNCCEGRTGESHELDAVFANDGEDVQHIGDAEEVSNLLAQVDEFQTATCGFGRDVEASHGAQAHAVGMLEIGEVENDSAAVGNQLHDLGGEDVGGSGDEPALAVQ